MLIGLGIAYLIIAAFVLALLIAANPRTPGRWDFIFALGWLPVFVILGWLWWRDRNDKWLSRASRYPQNITGALDEDGNMVSFDPPVSLWAAIARLQRRK